MPGAALTPSCPIGDGVPARARAGAGLTGTAAGGLLVTLACVVAATRTGERLRVTGRASIAQGPNPGYYPRRIADQRCRAASADAAGFSR